MSLSNEALIIMSGIAVIILLLLLVYMFLPEPTIIQSVQSPDGMYTESNGGATTGFIYHLSVLEKGRIIGQDCREYVYFRA